MDPKQPSPATIDEYIAGFPPDVQEILQKVREVIHAAAPDATEKISYQMPTFYLNGNLVHFAAYPHHIGFYPAPTGIASFQDRFAGLKQGKGSVQFPLDQPIPFGLIREIVLFRVAENLKKKKK